MGIRRRGDAQGIEDVDLSRCVVEVVVPAHHVGDTHIGVVNHHGQVVGR